jgi:hypothetical protein
VLLGLGGREAQRVDGGRHPTQLGHRGVEVQHLAPQRQPGLAEVGERGRAVRLGPVGVGLS